MPEEVFIAVVGFGNTTSTKRSVAWLLLNSGFSKSNGYRAFDIYHGVELSLSAPTIVEATPCAGTPFTDSTATVNPSFSIDADLDRTVGSPRTWEMLGVGASSFSALLLTTNGSDPSLQDFLTKMTALTQKPLS